MLISNNNVSREKYPNNLKRGDSEEEEEELMKGISPRQTKFLINNGVKKNLAYKMRHGLILNLEERKYLKSMGFEYVMGKINKKRCSVRKYNGGTPGRMKNLKLANKKLKILKDLKNNK